MEGIQRQHLTSSWSILSLSTAIVYLLAVASIAYGDAPVINVASLQMSVSQSQPLTVSGGCSGPYNWSIVSGAGSLSNLSGNSVTYTAPGQNPNCQANAVIRCVDRCGEYTDVAIAVNANQDNYLAYIKKDCIYEPRCLPPQTPGCNSDYGCCQCAQIVGYGWKCDGSEYKPYGIAGPVCGTQGDGAIGNYGPQYSTHNCPDCIRYICNNYYLKTCSSCLAADSDSNESDNLSPNSANRLL